MFAVKLKGLPLNLVNFTVLCKFALLGHQNRAIKCFLKTSENCVLRYKSVSNVKRLIRKRIRTGNKLHAYRHRARWLPTTSVNKSFSFCVIIHFIV